MGEASRLRGSSWERFSMLWALQGQKMYFKQPREAFWFVILSYINKTDLTSNASGVYFMWSLTNPSGKVFWQRCLMYEEWRNTTLTSLYCWTCALEKRRTINLSISSQPRKWPRSWLLHLVYQNTYTNRTIKRPHKQRETQACSSLEDLHYGVNDAVNFHWGVMIQSSDKSAM